MAIHVYVKYLEDQQRMQGNPRQPRSARYGLCLQYEAGAHEKGKGNRGYESHDLFGCGYVTSLIIVRTSCCRVSRRPGLPEVRPSAR